MKKLILVALLMVTNVYSQNYTPSSSDNGLRCVGNNKYDNGTSWYEDFWIINVDSGYVVDMFSLKMDEGKYNLLGNSMQAIQTKKWPITNTSVTHIKWSTYNPMLRAAGAPDHVYTLNRETLELKETSIGSPTWNSCEIIPTQELEEII